MMRENPGVLTALPKLIIDGSLSEDALQCMTQIDSARLEALLDPQALNSEGLHGEEGARLSVFTARLTHGFEIEDDGRLQGILESLVVECGLSIQNIGRLTALDVNDLRVARADPENLSPEKKYSIALRASYLINTVSQVRQR